MGSKLGTCRGSPNVVIQEFIMAVTYGFNLCLLIAAHSIRRKSHSGREIRKGILLFVTLLFLVTTVQTVAYMRCYRIALDVTANKYQPALTVLVNAFVALEAFLADCLMIYRCYAIWDKNYKIAILPIGLLIGSLVCIVLFLKANALGRTNTLRIFLTTYISLSVGINTLVTVLISGRILWLRAKIRQGVGKAHTTWYSALVAVFVESVALYTISGILIIVLLTEDVAIEHILEPLYSQISCTAALLLTIRIGLGFSDYAASNNNRTSLPPMKFSTRHESLLEPSPPPTALHDSSILSMYTPPDTAHSLTEFKHTANANPYPWDNTVMLEKTRWPSTPTSSNVLDIRSTNGSASPRH